MRSPYDIIIKPVVSEATTIMMEENKYTFEVLKKANKIEIKDAVEKAFGVEVQSVRTMIVKGKLKRQGRTQGRRKTWKKAIIKLTDDSKQIELFDGLH